VQVSGTSEGLLSVEPPRVRVELRAKGRVISRAVSASYGFEESTGDVTLRQDEADARKIAPNTITLHVIEGQSRRPLGCIYSMRRLEWNCPD